MPSAAAERGWAWLCLGDLRRGWTCCGTPPENAHAHARTAAGLRCSGVHSSAGPHFQVRSIVPIVPMMSHSRCC